jgi:glutamate synthase (ferredoxin)
MMSFDSNDLNVKWQRVQTAAGEKQLKDLIAAHGAKTGSQKAQEILSRWAEYLPKFWQLVPPSEAETPEASAKQAVSRLLTLCLFWGLVHTQNVSPCDC